VFPENIHAPTAEGHWKFQGGVVLKAKNFRGKYVPKLELPEGWGFKHEFDLYTSKYGMYIFWNNTIIENVGSNKLS